MNKTFIITFDDILAATLQNVFLLMGNKNNLCLLTKNDPRRVIELIKQYGENTVVILSFHSHNTVEKSKNIISEIRFADDFCAYTPIVMLTFDKKNEAIFESAGCYALSLPCRVESIKKLRDLSPITAEQRLLFISKFGGASIKNKLKEMGGYLHGYSKETFGLKSNFRNGEHEQIKGKIAGISQFYLSILKQIEQYSEIIGKDFIPGSREMSLLREIFDEHQRICEVENQTQTDEEIYKIFMESREQAIILCEKIHNEILLI